MTNEESHDWIKLKPKEIESLIIELAKQGSSPAQIGLILRDKHGIPKVKSILKKSIKQILAESNIKFKSEKEIIEQKVDKLRSHILSNKHDYGAQKALTKRLWAVHKAL